MPVDVAVEEPDTWVVSDEADDEVALRWQDEDVSSGWGRGECGVVTRIIGDRVAI